MTTSADMIADTFQEYTFWLMNMKYEYESLADEEEEGIPILPEAPLTVMYKTI